jgi:hypothetical protein
MWTDGFKKSFIGLLETNEVEVVFTKVNGEERTMRCTLMPSAFKDYEFVSSQKNIILMFVQYGILMKKTGEPFVLNQLRNSL